MRREVGQVEEERAVLVSFDEVVTVTPQLRLTEIVVEDEDNVRTPKTNLLVGGKGAATQRRSGRPNPSDRQKLSPREICTFDIHLTDSPDASYLKLCDKDISEAVFTATGHFGLQCDVALFEELQSGRCPGGSAVDLEFYMWTLDRKLELVPFGGLDQTGAFGPLDAADISFHVFAQVGLVASWP